MKSSKNISNYDRVTRTLMMALGGLIGATALSAAVMSAVRVSADDEPTTTASATASVNVPATCTMGGDGMSSHTATVSPGTWSGASGSEYEQGIGKTTLTVFCSDPEGFAIYAVGYTGNVVGGNTLVGSSTTAPTIATGTATSGDTSNWSMKVNKITDSTAYMPEYMQEDNSYNTWHAVPNDYAKVAHFAATTAGQPSSTDTEKGAKLATTYAVYASSSQIADTYTGQVKYVMVHPNSKSAGTYNIKYYTSAGTQDTGLMPDETVNNYEPHTLAANAFAAPSGYRFAGWCTNNTGGAYACSGTSYADEATIPPSAMNAGSTLSLYAYWEEVNFDSAFAAAGKTKYNGYYKMQDASAGICNAVDAGTIGTVIDERDDQTYKIGKLADNKCWMLDNLALDLVAKKNDLTEDNTNASNTTLGYLKNGGGSGQYTGTAVAYAGSSNTYNTPLIAVSGTCNNAYCVNDPTSGQWTSSSVTQETINGVTSIAQGKIGAYYNYCAASAGSYCYASNKGTGNATEDICPKGWRLPTSGSSGEFNNLYSQYSGGSPSQVAAFQTALVTPLSGYFASGAARNQGYVGYFWSSTYYSGNFMYYLSVGSSNVIPSNSDNRLYSYSIRCVLSS